MTVDGAPQETQTVRELDHSVERFFLSVPPQGRRVVEVQFSGAVSVGGAYVLEPLRQPTAQADRFSMHVRAPDGWEVSNSREPHDSGGRAIEVSGTSEEDLQVPLIVARAGGTSRGVLDRLIGDR